MDETSEQFFDQHSRTYSDAIERCVPRYREMLQVMLDAVPPELQPTRILELGCGTGHLTLELTRRWPAADILAVDLSAEVLAVAAERFGESARVRFERAPMEDLELDSGSLDLVISSIAIHHLRDPQKAALFARVERWLRSAGVLVFADQFAGSAPHLDAQHRREWQRLATAAGVTEEEWAAWRVHESDHDHHSSLEFHLKALAKGGFPLVDCVWRHLLWTVLFAQSEAQGAR